jgi:hypothetical protein
MVSKDILIPELVRDFKGADEKLRKRAERFMREVSLGNAAITHELAARYVATPKADDRYAVLQLLATQDAKFAAGVWLEAFSKLPKAERGDEYAMNPLVFGADGTIFEALAEVLVKKRISEEIAADTIEKIAANSSRHFAAYKAKFEKLRKMFPSSKKIGKSVVAAIAQLRVNEQQCEDHPRSCSDND